VTVVGKLELNTGLKKEKETFFTDVILPVPIPKLFTYRIPFDLITRAKVGCRVIVQFGSKKILTGVIGAIHQKPPEKYEAKYILEVLDEHPSVSGIQLQLFNWMKEYYMCNPGDVLQVALPSGLKLSSQSKVQLHPHFDLGLTSYEFSEKESMILKRLENQSSLSYSEISKLLDQKNLYILIKSLISKEAVLIYEEVKDKYTPKMESRVRFTDRYVKDHQLLDNLFEKLKSRQQQVDIILKYLQLLPVYQDPWLNDQGIKKSQLQKLGSTSSVETLIKNGVFEQFSLEVPRFEINEKQILKIPQLSKEQQKAKKKVLQHFETENILLLHGITGSGKTEIYIDLIQDALENGHQVLYLLPEIALTTQIVKRLKKAFGDKLGVYHSKFSDNERVEVWKGVLEGRFPLVVGVRSSVFLPFDNLSLIIVDEEHEPSYKQFDPAPRYHARDTALMLARLHHAKTVLGSATPSLESFYQAKTGKYGYYWLKERYGDAVLPDIMLVDILYEKKAKRMQGDFSPQLIAAIKKTLEQDQQVIIFQNRRGYSPFVICQECAFIPKCENCAVSLTYHMWSEQLKCHYCGHIEKVPATCPACGSTKIKTVGFGTQKLEEHLKSLFPQAKIQRMDLDTTRKKYSYQKIIDDFENKRIDLLVGTQMVSKGLDFDHVILVGVFDADRMIHFPDFRSHERAYQLITQVSGRAGRRSKKGKVVIQTHNVKQKIFSEIAENDFQSFFNHEIKERELYIYPPFCRLIKIILKHPDQDIVAEAAKFLNQCLIKSLGKKRLLGPQEPLIFKIRNQYLMDILVKAERDNKNLTAIKSNIREDLETLRTNKSFKKVNVVLDIDPY